ncbi:MAG: hypothetical protein IJT00_03630 [Lachnospiraceae bacterium]|nr:hypothetical protein [Lachnospiraceae bacterium]
MKELFVNKDAVVIRVPEVDISNIFSQDLVRFILIIIALIAIVVLCYSGYKTISAVVPVLVSLFVGWLSIEPACRLTSIRSVQMFIFVLITFMGSMVIFFLSVAFGTFIRAVHIRNWLLKHQYIIATLLGAVLAFVVLYIFVYRMWLPDLLVALFLLITGGIVEYRHRFDRMTYNTYDDLIKLKTVEERRKEEEEKQRKREEKEHRKHRNDKKTPDVRPGAAAVTAGVKDTAGAAGAAAADAAATEESGTGTSKAEEPAAEASSADTPKAEVSATETPTADTPKAEAPTAETFPADTPKAEGKEGNLA